MFESESASGGLESKNSAGCAVLKVLKKRFVILEIVW